MKHYDYNIGQLMELTEKVGETATAQGPHDLHLSALLSAYATVAMGNPCCLQECANQTFKLSMLLAERAAAQLGGASTHVH
jgi:hypothetical protein